MFSVGATLGGGENMFNAGLSFKVGQANHVSTSRVAMAKEMKDMRATMAAQDANMMKALNEFKPELERFRVDTISKHKDGTPDIQRVRVIKDRG